MVKSSAKVVLGAAREVAFLQGLDAVGGAVGDDSGEARDKELYGAGLSFVAAVMVVFTLLSAPQEGYFLLGETLC